MLLLCEINDTNIFTEYICSLYEQLGDQTYIQMAPDLIFILSGKTVIFL
jgi:hypothetical protein